MFCSEKYPPRVSPVFVVDLASGIGVHDFSRSVIKMASTSNPPVETNNAAAVGLPLKWNTTLSKYGGGDWIFMITLGEGSSFCTGTSKHFPSTHLLNKPTEHTQGEISQVSFYRGEV